MTHDYHEGLPQFSEEQILHDGCGECEERGKRVWVGIAHLDQRNFARAWQRAAAWNKGGLPDISVAESDVLRTLWAVQLKLEPRGITIGEVPGGF